MTNLQAWREADFKLGLRTSETVGFVVIYAMRDKPRNFPCIHGRIRPADHPTSAGEMRPAAPASLPRLPVRVSPNFQASTAAIGAILPLAMASGKDCYPPDPAVRPGSPERWVCAASPPFGCPWVNGSNRPENEPALAGERRRGRCIFGAGGEWMSGKG